MISTLCCLCDLMRNRRTWVKIEFCEERMIKDQYLELKRWSALLYSSFSWKFLWSWLYAVCGLCVDILTILSYLLFLLGWCPLIILLMDHYAYDHNWVPMTYLKHAYSMLMICWYLYGAFLAIPFSHTLWCLCENITLLMYSYAQIWTL